MFAYYTPISAFVPVYAFIGIKNVFFFFFSLKTQLNSISLFKRVVEVACQLRFRKKKSRIYSTLIIKNIKEN